MNSVLGFLIIGSVLVFILISLGFFVKRFMDNKERIDGISKESGHELKRSLEEELKQKKEEEMKKLQSGDRNTIVEVLDRLFKSSKLAGWVKSKTYQLYNPKNISLIINMSGKEELINSKKEIVLKNGEVFTQNKHYLAVKKEYSEKVFMCASKVLEECFTNIPTLYKIYLSIYITDEDNDNQLCVLSLQADKDQYKSVKDKKIGLIETVDFYNAVYSYDTKNYNFKEVEPVATPAGDASLEKTMATKVSADTTFYGSTIMANNSDSLSLKNDSKPQDNSKISMETKVSTLSGSMILDKSQLNLDKIISENQENKSEFERSIDKLLDISGLKVNNEEQIGNIKILSVTKESAQVECLIGISESTETIKEEQLKTVFFKMVKEGISKSMFISNGAFALDAVTYASVNGIEIYDKEKLNKVVNK